MEQRDWITYAPHAHSLNQVLVYLDSAPYLDLATMDRNGCYHAINNTQLQGYHGLQLKVLQGLQAHCMPIESLEHVEYYLELFQLELV